MEQLQEQMPLILQRALSATYNLYFNAHVAHWNVEGEHFVSLHHLFNEIYDDAFEAVDRIAERIRALDVKIQQDFKTLLDVRQITKITDTDYVQTLQTNNEELAREWDAIAKLADQVGDSATVDMAGKRAATHDKFAWMLRSLTR